MCLFKFNITTACLEIQYPCQKTQNYILVYLRIYYYIIIIFILSPEFKPLGAPVFPRHAAKYASKDNRWIEASYEKGIMPSSEQTLIFSLLDKWLSSWRSGPLKECQEKSEELPSPLRGIESQEMVTLV